ncbi:MAG TPA: hypothetical protein VHH54_03675 [Actinomycetota bacterium]|nr:hypothetical protein [Actinomycetota bacterium]
MTSDELRMILGGDLEKTAEMILSAEKRLADLRDQVHELERLVASGWDLLEGKATHLPWPPASAPKRPPTLHDVIRNIVLEHGNQWLTTTYVTREIAARSLYRRRDGLPPGVRDVSARVSSYNGWFVRWGWYFRLRNEPGYPSDHHRFGPRL